MVRSLHRTKILFAVAVVFSAPAFILSSTRAANPESLVLNVNIDEAITITVTNPDNWASGQLSNLNTTTGKYESDLLRNKVNVEATTNNPIGVTVSMYTKGDTDLRNTASYDSSDATSYIQTLSSGTTASAFPTNRWGYSLDDTAAGSTSANYGALRTSASPIQLFDTAALHTADPTNNPISHGAKDVYFAAKADQTMQSGTYTRTVYFAAVTGTVDTGNPLVPTNPSTEDPVNNAAHYSSTIGNTTYTTRTTSGSGDSPVSGAMNATTTEVTNSDISSTYAQAYGVTSSNNSSALATAFGVSAGVAAVSGTAFFIAAKRKKDQDEEGS